MLTPAKDRTPAWQKPLSQERGCKLLGQSIEGIEIEDTEIEDTEIEDTEIEGIEISGSGGGAAFR
ncbi:MAG: hypothetical protein K1X83_13050 [Oligoflexia bacterium]|nr:hypothetical protein [Oligoflexia bacterium]